MELIEKPKRRSRWSTDPIIRKDGTVKITKPTKRDRELLWPLLERYPALPANYIAALIGSSSSYTPDHLAALAVEPGCYLDRHRAQKRSSDANYRYQCYSLAETRLKNFWHDLMACMVMAQIELGARAEGIDFITPEQLLAKAPEETRNRKHPETIEVTYTSAMGKERTAKVTPDDQLFALHQNGKARFYHGDEIDCHSKTIDTKRDDVSSIIKKFREYLAISDQQLVQRTYGIPGPVYFLFVCDLPARVESMRKLLLEVTKEKGSPYFLFDYFPSYDDYDKPPLPDGAFFQKPKKRAGYSDFYMNQI